MSSSLHAPERNPRRQTREQAKTPLIEWPFRQFRQRKLQLGRARPEDSEA